MSKPTIEQLTGALHQAWGPDTCFDAAEWNPGNPARGQCVASSLVVQEYLGGELLRYEVNLGTNKEMHYCNILPDGTLLDTTGTQYKEPITLTVLPVDLKGHASVRKKRLADPATRQRYERLGARVAAYPTQQ